MQDRLSFVGRLDLFTDILAIALTYMNYRCEEPRTCSCIVHCTVDAAIRLVYPRGCESRREVIPTGLRGPLLVSVYATSSNALKLD